MKKIQIAFVLYGERYSEVYIDHLASSIREKTSLDIAFICLTDRAGRIFETDMRVVVHPELHLDREVLWEGCRFKLGLFHPDVLDPDLLTFFFDLDTMVLGDLAELVAIYDKNPGLYVLPFHMIQTWRFLPLVKRLRPDHFFYGTSSVMMFRPGDFHFIYSAFRGLYDRVLAGETLRGNEARAWRTDELLICWAADGKTRGLSLSVFGRFRRCFAVPRSRRLAQLRTRLGLNVYGRTGLIGMTFDGGPFKPWLLATCEAGTVLRERRHYVYWDFPEYAAYWRKVVARAGVPKDLAGGTPVASAPLAALPGPAVAAPQ